MRLWSLHPKYLDSRGLVALWREALLAQAVLAGKTRGYTHHPQLDRFRAATSPLGAIAAYLRSVHAEAAQRGYHFDAAKIGCSTRVAPLTVTRGQMDFEWGHLGKKLRSRAPERLADVASIAHPKAHPLFRIVPGVVAEWERAVSTKKIRP